MNKTTDLHVYQVEATNACNLRCSFCPTFQPWNHRPTGLLSQAVLEAIDWSNTTYTELQMGGEPTIHPKLGEFIDWLHERGVRVGFSTNGTFHSRLAKIIDKVDIVTVNDDQFRTPTFVDRQNVFVQRLGIDYPILDYSRTPDTILPSDQYPRGCRTPLSYVSVMWNGDVVPCCMDQDARNVLGNVLDQPWAEIEHGVLRANFIASNQAGVANGICEYCTAPNPHLIHTRLQARLAARQHIVSLSATQFILDDPIALHDLPTADVHDQ